MRFFFFLLFAVIGMNLSAEVFKDGEYKYKISVPDIDKIVHNPHENHNLKFLSADSTVWFYVYALDVSEEPGDELADDDGKIVYKKSYIDNLDSKVFNVGSNMTAEKHNNLFNRIERHYDLDNGQQAVTITFFDKEYPHIVAAFGPDLDRKEIQETLSSFRTKQITTTRKFDLFVGGGSLLLILLGFWASDYIGNPALQRLFVLLGIIGLGVMIISYAMFNVGGLIWYWL